MVWKQGNCDDVVPTAQRLENCHRVLCPQAYRAATTASMATSRRRRCSRRILQLPLLPSRHHQIPDANLFSREQHINKDILERRDIIMEAAWLSWTIQRLRNYCAPFCTQFGIHLRHLRLSQNELTSELGVESGVSHSIRKVDGMARYCI